VRWLPLGKIRDQNDYLVQTIRGFIAKVDQLAKKEIRKIRTTPQRLKAVIERLPYFLKSVYQLFSARVRSQPIRPRYENFCSWVQKVLGYCHEMSTYVRQDKLASVSPKANPSVGPNVSPVTVDTYDDEIYSISRSLPVNRINSSETKVIIPNRMNG
jgi:hypothetical protein